MEVGPVLHNQEAVSQPDLLEVFAEQEITIFGVSGAFKDLAEMCPVDLNDASISVEAKNKFVVKAANEAGLEIEPEYEAVFNFYAEKLELERKFTVAEKAVQPPKEVADAPKPTEAQVKLLQSSPKAKHSELEPQHSVAANIVRQHRMAEAILARVTEKQDNYRPTTIVSNRPAERPVVAVEAHEDHAQSGRKVVSPKDERAVLVSAPIEEVVKHTERKEQIFTHIISPPQENNNDMASAMPIKRISQIQENIVADTKHTDMIKASPAIIHEMAPEDTQLLTADVAETAELEEEIDGYNLFEADEVVLLMAVLEQGQVHIDENSEAAALDLESQDVQPYPFLLSIIEEGEVVSVSGLPAPIEQIEDTISTLVEVFENAEDEAMEQFDQILEAIINMPEKLDALEVSPSQKESIIDEKLKVLFMELFEEAGIEYTPELIKSFVILTRAHYLDEILVSAKVEREEQLRLPNEIGTREFFQKLQRGLSAMKRAAIQLYEIGKSVLRLYGMSKVPALQTA